MIAYTLYFTCMSLLMGVTVYAMAAPVHKKQAQQPEEAVEREMKSMGPDAT